MDSQLSLDTPLTSLHGVGTAVARGLDRLGLRTVRDLLNHWPRRWEDYSQVVMIAGLHPGKVTIHARVEKLRISRTARRRVIVTEAILSDNTGTTRAVWFNQPYLANVLKEGQSYYFAGEFAFKAANLALQNPTFHQNLASGRGGKIFPVYPENSLINSKLIAKLVAQVINLADELEQPLPESIVRQHGLLKHGQAVGQLHQPSSLKRLELARRSLGFEELFLLILTGLIIRAEVATEPAISLVFDQAAVDNFLAQLPYKLTDDQRVSAWQIFQDLSAGHPMNRLLQGDVGSGKTVVALMAAVQAAAGGYQTALMVPTEILARQHVESAKKLLEPLGFRVVLVVGGLKAADKTAAYDQVVSGRADLIIGTHALLTERLQFARLGLVVIDEQHRFGVNQRTALKQKAELMPHLLSMTATPIPRSLALVVYGDLDISLLRHLPPGRQPIETKLFMEIERANAYAQIDAQLELGRQAFIICPQIEAGDMAGAKSVKAEFDRLQKTVFAHRRVGLLHGRLNAEDKNRVMTDFAEHKYDILIATSVIEVGIDVPNASIIMIESAEQFGLAQLHQLRGRVGRAEHQSYCYLFANTDSPAALGRLSALERTSDGFRLAQIDLETRGAGEIYGLRQAGQLNLRMANIGDTKLVAEARTAARSFQQTANVLEYPVVLRAVNNLKKVTTLD